MTDSPRGRNAGLWWMRTFNEVITMEQSAWFSMDNDGLSKVVGKRKVSRFAKLCDEAGLSVAFRYVSTGFCHEHEDGICELVSASYKELQQSYGAKTGRRLLLKPRGESMEWLSLPPKDHQ